MGWIKGVLFVQASASLMPRGIPLCLRCAQCGWLAGSITSDHGPTRSNASAPKDAAIIHTFLILASPAPKTTPGPSNV